MKVEIRKRGGEQYNKKWVRVLLLMFGSLMTLIALTQIVCLIAKPKGYEQIVNVLGDKWIRQLIIGLLCLFSYYLFKKEIRAAKLPVNQ